MLLISDLWDLQHTAAAELFATIRYPWEILPNINGFLLALGQTLPEDLYDRHAGDVWIAKSAKIDPTACINGPCMIDEEAEVRHCAYIRGNVLVGKKAFVGNSTELKNCILFDGVQVPHYNYVGDSVLGYRSHMGAGAVTSNVKSDKSPVTVFCCSRRMETHLHKMGAMLGDGVEIGCNSVLCPGTVIGRNTTVYPLCRVRGYVPADSIYKGDTTVRKV